MTTPNSTQKHFVFLLVLTTTLFLATTKANESNSVHFHNHEHGLVMNFQEGRHYHRILPAVPTNVETGNVEVLELFWYGCPHCFEFEKYLKKWEQDKPVNVEFLRMPAVLNRGWVPHARAYYALEVMGELDRIHPLFFNAIHAQGRRLLNIDSMTRFLNQHGIDAGKFKEAYNSLYVETKIKRSNQLIRQYGSNSVPTVIINGKYRSTASDAGGYEQLLQLVSQLAQQEANLAAEPASAEEKTN
jgi:thiol:disulfide interchange protein DsbA